MFADLIKRQANFDIARKWFSGIVGTIETLGEMPARCALAPEAEDLQDEVRLLLHGRKNRAFKIYFKIHQETESSGSVIVFHVRHWARKPLTNEELEELTDDHLPSRPSPVLRSDHARFQRLCRRKEAK